MAGKFDVWLKVAKPREQFAYHEGYCLHEPGDEKVFSSNVYTAREAYERGEVILVQRRIEQPRYSAVGGTVTVAPGKFQWLAIKRECISPPGVSRSHEGEIIRWQKRPKAGVR